MNKKRLFLFAGYDKDGIIDDALVHYVSAVSKFGDIVLCMDPDTPDPELKKNPEILRTCNRRASRGI